jgi:hypothetical protein
MLLPSGYESNTAVETILFGLRNTVLKKNAALRNGTGT